MFQMIIVDMAFMNEKQCSPYKIVPQHLFLGIANPI